jgi:serine/threonine protein kinase
VLPVPQQNPASHPDPGPGDCLGHYQIERLLGSGGMGEVYLASDNKLGRNVAVKILSSKIKVGEPAFHRFVQEAKAASALNHPNILVIHEVADECDVPFIVSEFVDGRTLTEIMRTESLPIRKVVDIAIQIAVALEAAHAAGIIHRDIKPDNVMVRHDGIVKILDFGLAKLIRKPAPAQDCPPVKNRITGQGHIIGTVNYMSPEQARGHEIDLRTDIFSLGTVMYEMISGHSPFVGECPSDTIANLIMREPLPLSRYSPRVPEDLERIVPKMLRKNRDKRYQTMEGVIADLKDLDARLRYQQKFVITKVTSGAPGAEARDRFEETPTLELKLFPVEEPKSYLTAQRLVAYLIAAAVVAALLAFIWYRQ